MFSIGWSLEDENIMKMKMKAKANLKTPPTTLEGI